LSDRIGVMVRGRMTGIVNNGPDARHAVGSLMTGAAAYSSDHPAGAEAA
jgi:simple sugar transport system ATP-binding protein